MTPTHLLALLEGLEVPNAEWWATRHPNDLKALGKAIAGQAKMYAPDDRIERIGAALGRAAREQEALAIIDQRLGG